MCAMAFYGFTVSDANLFVQALEAYFYCQALGHLPNQTSQCDPKEYQQYIYPELYSTSNYLTGFLTTANLTFVINWSAINKFFSRFYYKKEKSSNVTFPNSDLTVSSKTTVSTQMT